MLSGELGKNSYFYNYISYGEKRHRNTNIYQEYNILLIFLYTGYIKSENLPLFIFEVELTIF